MNLDEQADFNARQPRSLFEEVCAERNRLRAAIFKAISEMEREGLWGDCLYDLKEALRSSQPSDKAATTIRVKP